MFVLIPPCFSFWGPLPHSLSGRLFTLQVSDALHPLQRKSLRASRHVSSCTRPSSPYPPPALTQHALCYRHAVHEWLRILYMEPHLYHPWKQVPIWCGASPISFVWHLCGRTMMWYGRTWGIYYSESIRSVCLTATGWSVVSTPRRCDLCFCEIWTVHTYSLIQAGGDPLALRIGEVSKIENLGKFSINGEGGWWAVRRWSPWIRETVPALRFRSTLSASDRPPEREREWMGGVGV